MKKIAAVGRNSLDHYYAPTNDMILGEKVIVTCKETYIGGTIANTAAVLSSLNVPTVLFDTLNLSDTSKRIVRELSSCGVETGLLQFSESAHIPETHIILPSSTTDNGSTIIVPVYNEPCYEFDSASLQALSLANGLYTNISYIRGLERVELHRFAQSHAIPLFLDIENTNFSSRYKDWDIFETATILFFNQLGFEKFAGDAQTRAVIDQVCTKPDQLVIITKGCQGASLYTRESEYHVQGISEQPVDTTGAGDTFNAIFLWSWLAGDAPEHALELANYGAALSVSKEGPRSFLQCSPQWNDV